ncbi:MAG TPA: rod shape-determining protein [Blastocatellia bacterium]|nr:rod shape-determining protein [Blastocatellia bacterium]
MVLPSLHNLIADDLSVDLGTTNTLIAARGRGIVASGPSLLAISDENGEVVAVGIEALDMKGHLPVGVRVVSPMRSGVVANPDLTAKLLSWFLRRARGGRMHFIKHVIVGVPPHLTEIEVRALDAAVNEAGASKIYFISQGLAAAVGAGLPVTEPKAVMIADIGGGVTNVSVIASARTIHAMAEPIGGSAMDKELEAYFRKEYGLVISDRTAERVKMELGSATPPEEGRISTVIGQGTLEDKPQMIEVSAEEIFEVIEPITTRIVHTVRKSLEGLPPDAAADLYVRGIVITGGTSLLKGLRGRIEKETGLKTRVSENPLHSTAVGGVKLYDNPLLLRRAVRSSDYTP